MWKPLILAWLSILGPASASAAPVTWQFAGVVTDGVLIAPGTPFSGRVTFDPGGTRSAVGTGVSVLEQSTPSSIEVTVAGTTYSSEHTTGHLGIVISNDRRTSLVPIVFDGIAFASTPWAVVSADPYRIILSLTDLTTTLFAAGVSPDIANPPSLDALTGTDLRILPASPGPNVFEINHGDITQLRRVPEPGSFALVLGALGALYCTRAGRPTLA